MVCVRGRIVPLGCLGGGLEDVLSRDAPKDESLNTTPWRRAKSPGRTMALGEAWGEVELMLRARLEETEVDSWAGA